MRRTLALVLLLVGLTAWLPAQEGVAPAGHVDSLKFAVIGDTGTGAPPQFEVARQMVAARAVFPFDMVIMLGDNIYGGQSPQDFVNKFARPYAALLQAGVVFYASLGNHDNQTNRLYKDFNMGGERYYTFVKKNVAFFVLDSNQLDPAQRAWIDNALMQSRADWKICYFHHPLYSDARRHGPDLGLRLVLEPIFVRHGVNVVLSGHDHVYERLRPQKGITYFVEGAGGELRKGDMQPSSATAASFDQDQSFMLIEVSGDELSFQALSRDGQRVDSGVIRRQQIP
jgi:Calcineurin-like phosphoesterase